MDVDGAGAPGGSPTAVTTRVYNTISIGKHAFTVDARYTDLRPIGRGGYGLVASALDTVTNERVAIKRITNVFDHVGDALRILREVRLLAHLRDHPNIVGLRDIMVEPAGSPAFHTLYLVTALFDSDLDKVVRSGQPLTDAHAQFFTYQALRGVKYIHSAITLHRDLKPANLLVNADCRLAICDFNLGRGVDLAAANKLTACVGVGGGGGGGVASAWGSRALRRSPRRQRASRDGLSHSRPPLQRRWDPPVPGAGAAV